MEEIGFATVLAYAALPAAANFAGGLAAELVGVSRRTLDRALHAAAGIVLAVVGVELMPRVLVASRPWVGVVAFVAGGVFAVSVDRGLALVRRRLGTEDGPAGPWMIYFGVSVDLLSDGLMIGAGATVASSLALLLALGQTPADVPEGFASMAALRRSGVSRAGRVAAAAAFAVPVLLGATLGFFAVRGGPELLKLSLLAFTAGILLTIAVEEMMVEAHEVRREAGGPQDPVEAMLLVGGFALFALLAAYL